MKMEEFNEEGDENEDCINENEEVERISAQLVEMRIKGRPTGTTKAVMEERRRIGKKMNED